MCVWWIWRASARDAGSGKREVELAGISRCGGGNDGVSVCARGVILRTRRVVLRLEVLISAFLFAGYDE